MPGSVLLVHDDLAAINAIRRALAPYRHPLLLATSAADAILTFGQHLPSLVLLAPSVESGRGRVVLEELSVHPDGGLARFLLLGESVPGFGAPIVPWPSTAEALAQAVQQAMRPPIELAPVVSRRAGTDTQVPYTEHDARRLLAKYEQIQEVDYFAVLGLPRTAGAADVQRAWERLSAEFHPLKFAAHHDSAVFLKAQAVHALLAEAAMVLAKDRLRAGYARNLVD